MNNFDKHIKEKLHNAELPVSGGIWEAIESQILVQKEPSRLWFLFLLAAFSLPIFFLSHIGEKNKKQQNDIIATAAIGHISDTDKAVSTQFIQKTSTSKNDIGDHSTNEILTSRLNTQSFKPVNNDTRSRSKKSGQLFSGIDSHLSEETERLTHINSTDNNIMLRPVSDNILPLSHIIKPVKKSEEIMDLGFKRYYAARECPTFSGFNPGLYVYGEVSVGQSSHNLTPKNQEFGDYTQIREDTEKGALSYSTTLGVGYQFQNGMIAESGLSYENLRLKFDPQGSSSIKNVTVIKINTEITDMDTIITMDTLNVYSSGIVDIRPYNSFRQLDIPFVLGYEFPLTAKLRMSLKGGILINLVSMSKGQVVGQDDFPAHFGKGNETDVELYKNNIGFSYTGGLNLEADLAPNITMYAGANVKYFPNSFSNASNPINQRFYRLGLTTGIKYRI